MSGSILLSDLSGLFGIHAESGKANRKRGGQKNVYAFQISFNKKTFQEICTTREWMVHIIFN